jgi:dinuclear metal center YbgI/SA1388 family protein
MTIRDIARILEAWAPPSIAWENDNVGLQLGAPSQRVRGILVALDITDGVIDEARARKANLIVTHHPMLFRPVRSIDTETRVGRMARSLLRSDIAVFSAHTNLDFAPGGVSFVLAERLGLTDASVLSPTAQRRQKIVTFVPRDHVDAVRAAMAAEGAGVIGEYSACSFGAEGMGTFHGSAAARPAVGAAGRFESAEEVRLEMIADEWNMRRIVAALRAAHPYEEAAYDIYRLENDDRRFGAGAIGALAKPIRLRQLLARVRTSLGLPVVRYAGDLKAVIRTVAVCGGSGSDLLGAAIAAGADAFVTADVRYHAFQEPDGRIALVDAGHFETEHPIVAAIADALRSDPGVRKHKIRIDTSRASKNPVQYFSS